MAMEVQNFSLDLLRDVAMLALNDPDKGAQVHIMVPVAKSGDLPESRLKELAADAARKVLQDALTAL